MLLQNTFQFFKIKPVAALSFLFSSSSLMIAIWATALPFVKQRLALSDGQLGLILLLAPIGSLTGVWLSTKIFGRIKVGNWMGWGNIVYGVLICAEVLAPTQWAFGIALYFRGMMGFLNGVATNTVASNLEKEFNRRLLSTCHAMYSVGGAVGAAFAATMFGFKWGSQYQIVAMFCIVTGIILLLKKNYIRHDYLIHSGSGYQVPNKSILGLSFICLVLFMTEGSIVDWSSIFLQRDILAPMYLISVGYGGFSIAMTLGRLNGDMIIPRLGDKNIVVYGAIMAAIGVLLVSISFHPAMAIAGFIITGIGCCCIVPVLFTAATYIPNISPVQGFGMITTGGLIGFVAGPSIIGFISEQWGLHIGFSFVFIMLLLAALVGWRNRFLA
jgi:MFS family permease